MSLEQCLSSSTATSFLRLLPSLFASARRSSIYFKKELLSKVKTYKKQTSDFFRGLFSFVTVVQNRLISRPPSVRILYSLFPGVKKDFRILPPSAPLKQLSGFLRHDAMDRITKAEAWKKHAPPVFPSPLDTDPEGVIISCRKCGSPHMFFPESGY